VLPIGKSISSFFRRFGRSQGQRAAASARSQPAIRLSTRTESSAHSQLPSSRTEKLSRRYGVPHRLAGRRGILLCYGKPLLRLFSPLHRSKRETEESARASTDTNRLRLFGTLRASKEARDPAMTAPSSAPAVPGMQGIDSARTRTEQICVQHTFWDRNECSVMRARSAMEGANRPKARD